MRFSHRTVIASHCMKKWQFNFVFRDHRNRGIQVVSQRHDTSELFWMRAGIRRPESSSSMIYPPEAFCDAQFIAGPV